MKRIIVFICLSEVVLSCLCGCGTGTAKDGNIPKGYTSYQQYFDKEGFRDYTDYCYYVYDNADAVVSSQKYKSLEPDTDGKSALTDEVKEMAEDFIRWMKACERENELKFSLDDISGSDYVYIKKHTTEVITLYYFDAETNTLHYMHSNT